MRVRDKKEKFVRTNLQQARVTKISVEVSCCMNLATCGHAKPASISSQNFHVSSSIIILSCLPAELN